MPKTFAADVGQTTLIPQSEPTATEPGQKTVGGKLGVIIELLRRPQGAEISDMMTATGWQPHSVRGALAGALKHRGFKITSEKLEGPRVYRILDRVDAPTPAAAASPLTSRRAATAARDAAPATKARAVKVTATPTTAKMPKAAKTKAPAKLEPRMADA